MPTYLRLWWATKRQILGPSAGDVVRQTDHETRLRSDIGVRLSRPQAVLRLLSG